MSNYYDQDHRLAKIIVAHIIIAIYGLSYLVPFPCSFILNVLNIYIWIFLVNPVAYVIEYIRKHPHKHNKL
jgi:hypothetical protein